MVLYTNLGIIITLPLRFVVFRKIYIFMYKRILQKINVLGIATLIIASGCTREPLTGVDNGSVIKTPYSLYAAKQDGMVIQTTTGESYKFVFPPDGYPAAQLLTAGGNLMMTKGTTIHMSTNEGKSFNPVYTNIRPFPWQSCLYYHAPFGAVYTASTEGEGVYFSQDFGATWEADIFLPGLPSLHQVNSFAGLDNGDLYAYSNVSNLIFHKTSVTTNWTPVTVTTHIPAIGTNYYLTSAENTLYLTDYNGTGGVWMSQDGAASWTKLSGNLVLPNDVKYTGTAAPYGTNVVVIATETDGIFRSDENGEFQVTTGLPRGTKVNSLSRKVNIYKNDAVKVYIYAATSSGIYRSEDGGDTWFYSGSESWKDEYTAIY